MPKLFWNSLVAVAASATSSAYAANPAPAADYFNDKFTIERVLDWGDRPIWSPDSKRIAFVPDYKQNGPAYEMDVATRQVRCLTCRWGASGLVSRIYYLPDSSYLIVSSSALGSAEAARDGKPKPANGSELYWMPADASLPPQPLNAQAMGEIALDYQPLASGGARIAWGIFGVKPHILMGTVVNDGKRAFLVNRTILIEPSLAMDTQATLSETYDFIDDGKSILFATLERNPPSSGMYKIDIATGAITRLPTDGQHNETHSFPNVRYGLEESNRGSDSTSPYRGVSAHRESSFEWSLKLLGHPDAKALARRYGGKTFDLYAQDWQTGRRRRLTEVSHLGGQAHQSSPARDGRHIAFTMEAPKTGPYAGKEGLYIGTFHGR